MCGKKKRNMWPERQSGFRREPNSAKATRLAGSCPFSEETPMALSLLYLVIETTDAEYEFFKPILLRILNRCTIAQKTLH
jgi:hypothetical protein